MTCQRLALSSAAAAVFGFALLACSVPAAPTPAQVTAAANESAPKEPGVPKKLRRALLAGDWNAAGIELVRLEREQPQLADWWSYLRGTTLVRAGQLEPAVALFEGVEKREPASVWRHKARFARAEALRALGRVAQAQAVWEAEARRLLSEQRQEELAAIYLGFAETLSAPNAPASPEARTQDLERACVLYERVLALDVGLATRERARYRRVVCRQEQQRWSDAFVAAREYRAEFDPTLSGSRAIGEHIFDVLFRKSQSALRTGDRAEARRGFEDLSAAIRAALAGEAPWSAWRASASPATLAALAELDGDAQHALARAHPDGAEAAPQIAAALTRFVAGFPEHTLAAQAAHDIGAKFQLAERDEDALKAFDEFLALAPPRTDDAARLEAFAWLRMSALYRKGVVLTRQGKLEAAIAVFNEYVARYPTGPDWTAAQQGIVNDEYEIGAALRRDGEFERARAAWNQFLVRHPLDARAERIALDLAELHVERANALRLQAEREKREPPATEIEAQFRAAIAQWRRVAGKYPGSNTASQALLRIGGIAEAELADLEMAVAAYRECSFGDASSAAAANLERMTAPSLTLQTERVWRTSETPKVRVDVRNLEKLEVELFALDLEAYFRKNLTHRGVEQLDLDLIAADSEFSKPVDGYAKYKPIRQDIELPVRGPGVWAVAVTAGEWRATTLVIASDIDVLVRSSQAEALVFVEDMARVAAVSGARVLLAGTRPNGTPEIRELSSGEDGTVRRRLDELGDSSQLRVLVLHDGHVATNDTARSPSVATSLSSRGIAYTDRPVYRPGETVHWRAILREARDGRLTFEPGATARASITDASGNVAWTGGLALSRFGTIHGELELGAGSQVGTYRLSCHLPGNAAVSGEFQVQQFQPPRVELVLEPAREVYFRGERVEVTARASYYWGEPVANSPLRATLPDGRELDVLTAADGTAVLQLETRDFPSEQLLTFTALLGEEQAAATASVFLALREFNAELSTRESTYLADTSFDVTLETVGADGEPIAKAMTLEVLRKGFGETRVRTLELATDAATGTVHTALTLAEGGEYVLRARGQDRFGNLVEAQRGIFISGDDDPLRLRFIVATHQLKVGERASFDLINRADAGLALITVESDTILEHRIVRLTQGSNPIALAIEHVHFPNFSISAAMMRAGEFVSDTASFAVTRELSVKITPERALYRPGEKVAVLLSALDQLGRPVEAELSLAVYDEALLALFPDKTPAIRGVFESHTLRAGKFTTSSSCAFRYAGPTWRIAEALIAEAERVRERERWERERAQTLQTLGEIAQVTGGPATPGPLIAGSDEFFLGRGEGEKPSAYASRRAGGGGKGGGGLGQGGGGGRGGAGRRGPGAEVPYQPIAEAPPEFAFWSPSIVTDASGQARIEFTLPRATTRWHLASRGVDTGVLVGEATASLISTDEFFVELRAPLALVEGDAPRCVARVHNSTGMTGTAKLVLRVTNGAQTQSYPLDVQLVGAAPVEATFVALNAALPGQLELTLDATAELSGVARDGTLAATVSARPYRPQASTAARLEVRPWGIEFAASKSGVLRGTTSVALELDGARKYSSRSLELSIGPSVDSLLLSAAFGDGLAHWGGGLDNTASLASQLVGVCATLELVSRSGRTTAPEFARLQQRAQALAGQVLAAQSKEGHWPWIAGKSEAHVPTSCTAMIALAAARARGATVADQALERGEAYLAQAFRDASQQADETKALLSWALAAHGQGDFGALNRLHRQRATLSPAALAYTALAFAQMENLPMAREVAESLASKLVELIGVDGQPLRRCGVAGNGAWMRSEVEMTALAALALERAHPESPALAPAIEFLLARAPWRDGRARGLAVAAVATHRQAVEPLTQRVRVLARIAGETRTIELSPDAPAQSVRIDLAPASASQVAFELVLEGRGAPHFAAVLRGVSSDFTSTESTLRTSQRIYLAATPRFAGKPIDTGFEVLQDSRDTWRNEVAELAFGALVDVHVSGSSRVDLERLAGESDYLVVEIPLPAGTRVLEGSVRGAALAHAEQRGGALFAHLGQLWPSADAAPSPNAGRIWQLDFTLIGAVPGAYRALPVVVRSLYEPERMGIGTPGPLTVLARGETSRDEYRATPDELFGLGLALFEAGEKERARELLQRLIDEFETKLREAPLAAAANALLFANIERKSPRDVVRYFEILKEKDPELTIPFASVLAVGAAYRDIEEHERALSIFRATIEETFGKELRVVGTLEEQGEHDGALDTLARLCGEYPDSATVVEASLTLADKLIQLAPKAHAIASLEQNGRTRASLTFDGVLELQRFLALHPRDPRAPDAGLALIAAHLGLADFVTASELGDELAAAYTEPRFADAFRYSRAVAEWYLGRDGDATQLLGAIAEAEYKDANGGVHASVNRELALYILAQIHHARQEFEKAASYYERIDDEFPDARETLAGLREKLISLPEVTEVRPGGAVQLELSHKNVARAELLVYPVDLMTLYLREKNLSKITEVNLSGITPAIARGITLAASAGMRSIKTKVALELADAGAYLVICRGDELHASGLVLISGLELEVREDADAGTLRVQVLDRATQRFVRDVDVRVIGTGNDDFASGTTDPRGLFTAYGLAGEATVIARSVERQYAFHRGARALGVAQNKAKAPPQLAPGGETYFKNVLELNDASQNVRDKNWQEELRRDRTGVQIQQVK